MSEELNRELRQLQQYAATLQGLLSEAQERSPERVQGEDTSGAVSVVLDAEGQPQEFRVASDWQRRVEPPALAAAVTEAFGQAAEARMQAWTRALEGGEWGDKVGRMMRADSLEGSQPSAGDVPQLFRRDQAPVTPRPVGDLTEDMIRAFGNVDEYAKASPTTQDYSGSNGSGKVTVKLSQAGLAGCTIDGYWAADQSGASISQALGEALSVARNRMRASAGEAAAGNALGSLFDEAMALLNDPRRLADS